MVKQLELKLLPKQVVDEAYIRRQVATILKININSISAIVKRRRSLDARQRKVLFILRLDVYIDETPAPSPTLLSNFQILPPNAPNVIVVGAGPAGYFAALQLIELGLRPIIFDRGKDVRTRRRDLRAIQQFGEVNPHSNYCFGEGGAGTYSDGKLYTRSKKRGNYIQILELLVDHGAKSDILIDAHPHIGSNKLPGIVQNIRKTIEQFGGQVHFDSLITDFIVKDGHLKGVIVNDADEYLAKATILCTGHSARDIFSLLHQHGIRIEAKAFALGVRVEHDQQLIDKIQYRQTKRDEHLPASSYRLACQVQERGVFSFCMCPGGLIVPAATAPGELVVNGMSMSKRDSKYANSGTVVAVEPEDLKDYQHHGVFAGLEFQKSVEQHIFSAGDGSQQAPAQRLMDFAHGKLSDSLNDTSYIPGIYSAPLHQLLPKNIAKRLRQGVQLFDKKMKGYFTNEANVIGLESRTSSPIRIPRSKETYMHEGAEGLFPCGEGAGYAGGILSAAIDGQNVAKAVARFLK